VQAVLRRLPRLYSGIVDGAAEQVEDTDAKAKELYKARIAAPKADEFKGIVPSPDPKDANDRHLPVICLGAGGKSESHR
jgi:hypothetical protein